ncbi:16586_t:CDS:2 [Entrophospora sp. SA101]|nr:16586_t:CDS:2 [Entrophospora sp. SA101]
MLGLVVEGIENLVADVEGVEGVVRGFVVAENEGNNEVGVVDAVLGVSVVSFEIFKVLDFLKKIETNQQKEVTIVKVKLKNNNKIVKLIPDAHIFTIFITEFAYRYENMPMAIKVYETMLKYNISPNVVTFTILIEGFGMSGELEKALEYFNIMTNKYNIKPNVKTYTSLIKALVKTKNLEKAEQVWYQMIKEGIKPERATYKVLKHINDDNYLFPRTPQKIKDAIYRLDLIKNIHNVDTVYELYKNFIKLNFKNKYNNTNDNSALAHKDIDSKTDVCSFTMFISIFSLRFGDMQKSLEIFQAMLKYKIKPNTITFTKLIEGFANLGYISIRENEKAKKIYDEMLENANASSTPYFVLALHSVYKVCNFLAYASPSLREIALSVFNSLNQLSN